MIKQLQSGKYQVRYIDAHGIKKTHSLDTKTLAKNFEAEMRLLKKGTLPASISSHIKARTLRDLWRDANAFVTVNWKHASRVHFDQQARLFVEYCENKQIHYAHQVTIKVAHSYVNWLKNVYISPRKGRPYFGRTIDHFIITAGTLFRTELELGEPPCITRNPFKKVELRGSRPKRPPKHISLDHLKAFLSMCPEFEWHAFCLQYSGGLRPNELRELTWEVVKEERLALGDRDDLMLKSDASMGASHVNELMRTCLTWFRNRTNTKRFVIDGSIFASSDGHGRNKPKGSCPVGKTFLSEKFAAVRDRAKLAYPDFDWNNFTPHKLRTAYGSHLRKAGVELSDVSKMLRHKHESTTERWYINTGPSPFKEQAAVIDTFGIQPMTWTPTYATPATSTKELAPRSRRKSVHKVSKPLPGYAGLNPMLNSNIAENTHYSPN